MMVAAGIDYKYRKKGIWCIDGGKKVMLKFGGNVLFYARVVIGQLRW